MLKIICLILRVHIHGDMSLLGVGLADLGSHILATEYLLGPIKQVMGDCTTVMKRKTSDNKSKK